jgi:hypothetical protein
VRDFIEKREEIERRMMMAGARPAPDWIVAKRREYRVGAALWSVGPQAVWLLSLAAAFVGMAGEWGRQWKRAAPITLIAWGGVDLLFGMSKRAKKYRKAAGILTAAIARFEGAQYADTGVLDAASREAAAALE